MLLCVGSATRVAEYLSDLPKTYRATARLDGHTLTDDNTSERVAETETWRDLTVDQVKQALRSQVGEIMQMPPQFSAKKIAGERAYDIARRGDVATLTPVQVTISDITLVRAELPEIEFDVECSSGTYIRAIARDVGAWLGTGGYLTALRRIAVGKHDVERAVPADELVDRARVETAAITPLQALSHMPVVELTEEQERAIRFGQSIEGDHKHRGVMLLVRQNKLIAVAQVRDTRLKPHKVFNDE